MSLGVEFGADRKLRASALDPCQNQDLTTSPRQDLRKFSRVPALSGQQNDGILCQSPGTVPRKPLSKFLLYHVNDFENKKWMMDQSVVFDRPF